MHFKLEDFIFNEFNIQTVRCHLKPTAIPSIFPWTVTHHCKSVTSQIAASSKQRYELTVTADEVDVNKFKNNFCSITEMAVGSDLE